MPANEHVQELAFAEVIGDRFGRYSKYIIQDRALPDIRDGLKPVQRRILFAMAVDNNTAKNPYRKSARSVGNVIGNYHPHGDSSVYNAMVRMSQDWKLREPLIDMHGNNGSMDGDPAAAMRYTEARLSPIAEELLADLEEDTVDYIYNFDDTMQEPTVLPAKFPNLLVNGATGISAGYATEIPPHNLGEVIDATVFMLRRKRFTIPDLAKIVKGPDFPTGGIIQGANDITRAYQKGRGRVVVRAKIEIENLRGGRQQIVATELPYEVNKARLIQQLDEIRLQRKVEGIADVRDETDRTGLRVVIELRRNADAEGIQNYLLLNTDLQINYNFNMVAINNRAPQLVNLRQMLEAYIDHQSEVITRRTHFRLNKAQTRRHIVDGLIRLMSILDQVIATIRASTSRQNAKENIMKEFDFSDAQAEAIVSLQLYRLTNTDVQTLIDEQKDLNEKVEYYNSILKDEEVLKKVMIDELEAVKEKYATPRRTVLEAEVEDISVDTSVLVAEEDVYVSVTKEGYYKRTSTRSFKSSTTTDLGLREQDYPLFVEEMNTHDHLLILTNKGNYIHIPVHELPDIRWGDTGQHLSQEYQLEDGEQVIHVMKALEEEALEKNQDTLVFMTKNGMIKQTLLNLFVTYRSYKTRTAVAMSLVEGDEVVSVHHAQSKQKYQVALVTEKSYGLCYPLDDVSTVGLRARGVIAINLAQDDHVVRGLLFDQKMSRPQVMGLTQRGNLKRFDLDIVSTASRGSRGTQILRELQSNPHRFIEVIGLYHGSIPVIIDGDKGTSTVINTVDITLTDRQTNGSAITNLSDLGKVTGMHPAILNMIE